MMTEPPEVDLRAGITVYATKEGRHRGRLRTTKEDFRVNEIFDLGQVEQERKEGYVPLYSLKKLGLDTPHAAEELGDALKSNVNFAGLKDSDAITVQYASARSSRARDPLTVTGKGFEAQRVGYLPRPITRGMISGNGFKIVVRTEEDLGASIDAAFRLGSERRLPNFFGYQRFGLKSMVNHKVGKAVIKHDFKAAVDSLLGEPRRGETPDAAEARRLCGEGNYREARKFFSPKQDIERRVAGYLAEKPDDHLGAFRRVPILPRRLFIHAYQSYLFNMTLSRAVAGGLQISTAEKGDNWTEVASDGLRIGKVHGVKEAIQGEAVPLIQLVGYAFRDYGSRFDRLIVPILEEEGIRPAQFYLKEAEEISSEGSFRQAPLLVTEMVSRTVEGGFELSFNLGRGEYATTLLREVLKPEDPLISGF